MNGLSGGRGSVGGTGSTSANALGQALHECCASDKEKAEWLVTLRGKAGGLRKKGQEGSGDT